MGFEEAFVFAVAGFLVSYYQRRSPQIVTSASQIRYLWILAVVLPSLVVVWTVIYQTPLPLSFAVTSILLGTWIYSNIANADENSHNAINLSPSEDKQLKDCFSPTIYHLRDLEYRSQEIYCYGTLRSQNYKYAYDTINKNIQKIFGDRFLCYLQESPIENLGTGFGASPNDSPTKINYCFYLRPSPNPPQPNRSQWKNSLTLRIIISSISIICTAFTVLAVGAEIYRPEEINLSNLQAGIPYLLGIASIFIARAIAQYYITKKNKLSFAPPILLPCVNGFGVVSSLHLNTEISFSPTIAKTIPRHILFDLAVIPTIAGLGISIILLFLGNWLLVPTGGASPVGAISPLMPNLDTFRFQNSIFITCLQTIFALGKSSITTSQAPEAIQALSPLTLAGWAGLALSALQILPFNLLDGGNLAIAMFGHRQVIQIARITRLVLLAIALFTQPWLRIYSLLLFFLPTPQPLILNETIEIDRTRDLLGIGLMAIALLIILPMPKSLFIGFN